MDTLLAMGFDRAAAEAALGSAGGNVDNAVAILLSADAAEEVGGTVAAAGVVTGSMISQYSFGGGVSACTSVACFAALRFLEKLSEVRQANMSEDAMVTELHEGGFLTDVVMQGVNAYQTMVGAGSVAAHASVDEVIAGSPELSTGMQAVGTEPITSMLTDDGSSFTQVVEQARAMAADETAYAAVVIVKPPETVMILVPPRVDGEYRGRFFFFDSHSRPHLGMEGCYMASYPTLDGLLVRLMTVFPKQGADLFGDSADGEASAMEIMYNSFEANTFQLAPEARAADATTASSSSVGTSEIQLQVGSASSGGGGEDGGDPAAAAASTAASATAEASSTSCDGVHGCGTDDEDDEEDEEDEGEEEGDVGDEGEGDGEGGDGQQNKKKRNRKGMPRVRVRRHRPEDSEGEENDDDDDDDDDDEESEEEEEAGEGGGARRRRGAGGGRGPRGRRRGGGGRGGRGAGRRHGPVEVRGPLPEGLSREEALRIEEWIVAKGKNEFGDRPGTMYTGSSPLFDERTATSRNRYEYIIDRHGRRPWNKLAEKKEAEDGFRIIPPPGAGGGGGGGGGSGGGRRGGGRGGGGRGGGRAGLGRRIGGGGGGGGGGGVGGGFAHLVGRDANEAKAEIEAADSSLTVQLVPQGSMVTADFRMDRVRVYHDKAGKVAREPRKG